jgi:hypothetical protein
MFFSCVGSFRSKKKKIPDLSLPPCILNFLTVHNAGLFCYSVQFCGAQAMPRVRDVCLPWSGQGRGFRRKFSLFLTTLNTVTYLTLCFMKLILEKT